MTIQLGIFLVLIFATFFSNGVQAYIHQEAYPLLPFVGPDEFPAYLKEFERRLPLPLLLPYALTVLSNIALLFTHPDKLPLLWLVIALVLNLAVTAVTVVLATPVYNRYKQEGLVSTQGLRELLNINILRLLLSTLSSAVIIYLLMLLF